MISYRSLLFIVTTMNDIRIYIYIHSITKIFGTINVWRIAKLKVAGKKKFGEWMDFVHKDTNHKLKLGWFKLADHGCFTKFAKFSLCQTIPLYSIC